MAWESRLARRCERLRAPQLTSAFLLIVGSPLTPRRQPCRRHLRLLLRRAGSRCCGWASGHWSRCSDGSRTTATSHGTRCLPSKRRSQRPAAWTRGGSALRVPRSLRRTWRASRGGATLEAPRGERQLAMVWQLVRCTQGQLLAQDSGCKLDVALARPRPCISVALPRMLPLRRVALLHRDM